VFLTEEKKIIIPNERRLHGNSAQEAALKAIYYVSRT
jgi:hypothetical protein